MWWGPCGCGDPTHDDNSRVPSGSLGTVDSVDDAGTIHVNWDNGLTLGLIPGFDIYQEVC